MITKRDLQAQVVKLESDLEILRAMYNRQSDQLSNERIEAARLRREQPGSYVAHNAPGAPLCFGSEYDCSVELYLDVNRKLMGAIVSDSEGYLGIVGYIPASVLRDELAKEKS